MLFTIGEFTSYTNPIMKHIRSLQDFEHAAKKKLPAQLFSYIYNGADNERCLVENRQAFDRFAFVPRMLKDVSQRTQSMTLFGHEYDSPFGISPVGLNAMWCYRGDVALAQAAQQANIPAVMSGASLIPMEAVAKAAPNTWFQAYMLGDMARVEALIERISRAGFKTLVLTVDLPVSVNPENYARHGFSSPLRPNLKLFWEGLRHPRWLMGTFLQTLARHGMPHFENWRAERGAPIISAHAQRDFQARDHLSWEHVKHIRALWPGKLVIKGLVAPEDAAIATALGADGLIISNHGGRQIDGAISPLVVLPEIVKVAAGATIMMDSGIRRGTDVLKALALGAHCVFLGRSFNYAATVGGQNGVLHAIDILQSEIHRNMAHLGLSSLHEVDRSILRDLHALAPITHSSNTASG